MWNLLNILTRQALVFVTNIAMFYGILTFPSVEQTNDNTRSHTKIHRKIKWHIRVVAALKCYMRYKFFWTKLWNKMSKRKVKNGSKKLCNMFIITCAFSCVQSVAKVSPRNWHSDFWGRMYTCLFMKIIFVVWIFIIGIIKIQVNGNTLCKKNF